MTPPRRGHGSACGSIRWKLAVAVRVTPHVREVDSV